MNNNFEYDTTKFGVNKERISFKVFSTIKKHPQRELCTELSPLQYTYIHVFVCYLKFCEELWNI